MSFRSKRVAALALITFASFIDIVAYSIAVPVLPDLSRRLGATPTTIGLLFASFGVTLLLVSIPMGAISDRVGRKGPLVGGLLVLAAASTLFAFANDLPALFGARLAQGAADAVTWVVGFALLADLYGPAERGRASGIVMSAASFAYMLGPSMGGWLYEAGGVHLPFVTVALMSLAGAAAFAALKLPARQAPRDPVPLGAIVRVPAVAACAAAVLIIGATISMLEPILALHLESIGVNPARIGLVFGIGGGASMILHPIGGRLGDRWGARRLTLWGLVVTAASMPVLAMAWSFTSAIVLFVLQGVGLAMAITPSLGYMAEVVADRGVGSFGVAYGLYNVAWGVGILGGPAVGGFMYERIGFMRLTLIWAPAVLLLTALLRARLFVPAPSSRPGVTSG